MNPVLNVKNLSVEYCGNKKQNILVDQVSFSVEKGKCMGILGESGSGKSMICKALTGLLDESVFKVKGSAIFQGKDLLRENADTLRKIRGCKIGMVLQNPMTCFDPLYRIGSQMAETFEEHTMLNCTDIWNKCAETLRMMEIKDAEDVLKKYPHQLSGGMLQRVMIGLALALDPELIIADEPTTAVDSISQYRIMQEFLRIKHEKKVAMIFVSHDLGVLSTIADNMIVMHQSNIIESGTAKQIFHFASKPYTRSLVEKCMAVIGRFDTLIKAGRRTIS